MQAPQFSIRADLFAATALCASTEEVRYYLNGVYVMPHRDGVLMVATDGHKMALAYDGDGSISEPAIISANFKHKALKAGRRDPLPRRLVHDGGGIAHVVMDGIADALPVSAIDGTFPDFWRILPEPGPDATMTNIAWNIEYLAVTTDAARICGINGRLVTFSGSTKDDPTWVRLLALPEMAFIVMPARGGDTIEMRPDWMDPAP